MNFLKEKALEILNDTASTDIRFKNKVSFNKRCEESARITAKYPNRIPIVCERTTKDVPKLDRNKYLVPEDLTLGQFMYIIRKRMKAPSHKSIFLFVNDTLVPISQMLVMVYLEHKDPDGFLYITYSGENTFG